MNKADLDFYKQVRQSLENAHTELRRLYALVTQQAQMLEERDREIEELQIANQDFAQLQDWWNDRMFELEQELERLRAQRVPLTKDQLIDEFCRTPDLHQLVSAFFAGARFAEAAHGIHPPKAASVNLCTYGYEIKSCTSEPMDCQCLLDSLNEEGPLQRLADLSKEIGEKL